MGRHSAPETDEERPEPLPSEPATPSELVAGTPAGTESKPAPEAGTRGDLQLLRADTGLMLWCAGTVVVLFLIYTSVLILIARTDAYLIWLWVPTVLSGMAIGGLLDRAHRAVAETDRTVAETDRTEP